MDENTLQLLVASAQTVLNLTVLIIWLIREIRVNDKLSDSEREELQRFRDIAMNKMQTTQSVS